MRLEFHRHILTDISRIMGYYEDAAGRQLADEFWIELRTFFQKAADSPEAYDILERDLRRVNLERFHITFCSASSTSMYAYWLFVTTGGDLR